MRKLVLALSLFSLILSLPAFALAGTAYIPLISVGVPSTEGADYVITSVAVSSISNVSQQVILSFYKGDGTRLAGMPTVVTNGGGTGTNAVTDTNGELQVILAPQSTLNVQLVGSAAIGNVNQGHGKITSLPAPGDNGAVNESGLLVANAFVRDNLTHDNSYILQRAITINGGNPF